jgi:anti-sigma regulatory factor (Ser/Thr protein kinase)
MPAVSAQPCILVATGERLLAGSVACSAGWRIDRVHNGADILKAVSNGHYDLVITDSSVAGSNGFGLLRALRAAKPRQIVFIIDEEAEVVETLLNAGASGFIQLCSSAGEFNNLIAEALQVIGEQSSAGHDCASVPWQYTSYTWLTSEIAGRKLNLALVDNLFMAGRIGMEDRLNLQLAFQEALYNSIEHGNLELESVWKEEIDREGVDRYALMRRSRLADANYSNRLVFIKIWTAPKRLRISIRDQGKGFLPSSVGAKLFGSDELSCHGRGLTLIGGIMNNVYYADKGTEIIMEKNI